ncbi:MAG TPA: hypothetical protein VIM16_01380 [Mucilaginibacter sp.]|jgi:hypothetical protein
MEASYNSINYLSDQEYKIHGWANSLLNRTRDADETKFYKEDIKTDYESIHNEYLNIYKQSDDEFIRLEALKRPIFLNWYYALEPDFLTGIKKLDSVTMFNAYKILNDYIKEEKLDAELTWMLKFYSSWEYIIFEYSKDKLNVLTSFVEEVDTTKLNFPEKQLDKGVMDNRGQMGIYWKKFVEKPD